MKQSILEDVINLLQERTNFLDESEQEQAVLQLFYDLVDEFNQTQINISKVSYKGEEYIELTNNSKLITNIGNWKLNAGDKTQDFTFETNTFLQPLEKIRVFTKEGERFTFNSTNPILNNKGDTVELYNENASRLCALAYGRDARFFIEVSDIFYNGIEGESEADEYIELTNLSHNYVDISCWHISAGAPEQDFFFPKESILKPYEKIRVYTNKINERFSFDKKHAIWNNKGDLAQLFDAEQNLVSEYVY